MFKFFTGFLTGFLVCLFLVIWTDNPQFPMKRIQLELKKELKNKSNTIFFLKDSNIQITKKADGTGVVRVVER
jgi:hypothetical protein